MCICTRYLQKCLYTKYLQHGMLEKKKILTSMLICLIHERVKILNLLKCEDDPHFRIHNIVSKGPNIIIRKAQGVPQLNNVAHPRHPEEEETSPNRKHIITSKR